MVGDIMFLLHQGVSAVFTHLREFYLTYLGRINNEQLHILPWATKNVNSM